jgi:hypothetical protein
LKKTGGSLISECCIANPYCKHVSAIFRYRQS